VKQNGIFSIIPPAFSITWSFRNHSYWFGAQGTFLITINAENI